MAHSRFSTAPPIIYGVLLVVLTLVLTLLYELGLQTDWFRNPDHWLSNSVLVGGWVIGACIVVGLILFIVSLARQIRLNQRQQNFIDSVTHELKSPLTSLKLHLETLQRRPLPHEQVVDFSRVMLADVERLDRLIDHVLSAAAAESPRRAIKPEVVDVRERIKGVIDAIRRRHSLAPEAIGLEGEAILVRTDPVGLDLVLMNLLDNAVKYSGDAVHVTVRVTGTAFGGVAIAVADEGVGIPPKQKHRVFNRFYRVGNEMTRTRQGTGLGLYIVKETVRQLQGSIKAASPGENQGSVFTLTLPSEPKGVAAQEVHVG